ncbi:hypothetical protein, partial [Paractinoplanes toevensis]|uniref:hypothetical protein n=1 Tax=Paractinoplanes toevensis TaxID=571911 RepID=UPI001BB3376E
MPGDAVGDVPSQRQQLGTHLLIEVGGDDLLGDLRRLERGLLVLVGRSLLVPSVIAVPETTTVPVAAEAAAFLVTAAEAAAVLVTAEAGTIALRPIVLRAVALRPVPVTAEAAAITLRTVPEATPVAVAATEPAAVAATLVTTTVALRTVTAEAAPVTLEAAARAALLTVAATEPAAVTLRTV